MADLITLDEYKLAEGLSDQKNDARIAIFIASASQMVKTYCARTFVDYFSTEKTEVFNVEYDSDIIQLSECPIIAITSVEERQDYSSDYSTLTTAAFEYYLDPNTDSILRTTTTGSKNWPIGPGAVKVVYTGGYSSIPEDLKLAVVDLVNYYYKKEYKPNKHIMSATITNSTSSSQWRNVGFPDHIKRVLDFYKHI